MAMCIWFFGRSGAGKTTVSRLVAERLRAEGEKIFCVDGDELRSGICSDLGFDDASRTENHRRAAEVAKLALAQGFTVLGATMCPQPAHRALVRQVLGDSVCIVYVDASHETCASRDPKGLYRKAEAGRISNFQKQTFVPAEPGEFDIDLATERLTPDECVAKVIEAARRWRKEPA